MERARTPRGRGCVLAGLEIRLLGGLEIAVAGRPVTDFESATTRALIARLAHEPGVRLPRAALAEMLWPDRPEGMALANLRHSLAVLRRLLGDHDRVPQALVGTRDTISLDAHADVWIDLEEFRRLAAVPASAAGGIRAWEAAAGLWRGTFCAGFDPVLGAEWESWLATSRAETERMAVGVLARLADVRERAGRDDEAIDLGLRALSIDPYDESQERRVVRLLARSGRAAEAIAHAEAYLSTTRADLGITDSPDLQALVGAVREGRVGPNRAVPDLPARSPRAPEPCVARDDELARLHAHLDDTLAGAGRMVFVTGAAGSGKSVLLRALAESAADRMPALVVLRGSCNAYAGPGDPYLPYRQMLGLLCGDLDRAWLHGELTSRQAQLLWEGVPVSVQAVLDAGSHLLGTMLDAEAVRNRVETRFPEHDVAARLGPEIQRAAWLAQTPAAQQPVLEEFVRVMARLSAEHPLLLLIDDLHYADRGTIDLTRHLAGAVHDLPVLVVAAMRPPAPVPDAATHPLSVMVAEVRSRGVDDDLVELVGSRRFVDAWLDAEPNRLDEQFREQLFATTRGHALFTVEVVTAMRDQGHLVQDADGLWTTAGPLDWDLLPPRVEALIAARLLQLDPQQHRDLEVASIQGETFLAEAVAAVREVSEPEVAGRLGRLSVAGQPLLEHLGLVGIGGRTVNRYRFRHRQFQQVLHAGLAEQDRVALHRGTADALREFFADRVDDIAVDLARHYDDAGAIEDAIEFHGRAGRRAASLSATSDAVVHLRRALDLLGQLEPNAERSEREVGLLVHLGACLQALSGYNAEDTTAVYERLRRLLDRVGPSMASAEALGSLATVDGLRGRYRDALASAEKLLAMSAELGAAPLESAAHSQLGWLLLMTARLAEAEHHLDAAIDTYDPAWDAWLTPALGNHVRSTALAWRAILRWIRGHPEAARRDAEAALAEARRVGHPFTLVLILAVAGCVVDEHLRDGRRVIAFADQMGEIAEREDFTFYRAAARLWHGLGLGLTGDYAQAFRDTEAGLAEWEEFGTRAFRPWIMSPFAEHLVDDGEVDWAARIVADLERELANGEERLADCFAPVARAGVLRARGDDQAAEAVLRDGVVLLESLAARGPLLRTTTALAALLCDHGRPEEAVAVLQPALATFDEGLDTPDVLAAAAALDRARGGRG